MSDKLSFESLELAIAALEQGLREHEQYPQLLTVRDGVIQRFEIAMAISRQLMIRVLKEVFSLEEASARKDTLREAAKLGLIVDAEAWLEQLKARNRTSHTYDAETAEQIFSAHPLFSPGCAGLAGASAPPARRPGCRRPGGRADLLHAARLAGVGGGQPPDAPGIFRALRREGARRYRPSGITPLMRSTERRPPMPLMEDIVAAGGHRSSTRSWGQRPLLPSGHRTAGGSAKSRAK